MVRFSRFLAVVPAVGVSGLKYLRNTARLLRNTARLPFTKHRKDDPLPNNTMSLVMSQTTSKADLSKASSLHFVVGADKQFQSSYEWCMDSMRCYAEKKGYTFAVLDISHQSNEEGCRKQCWKFMDPFFRKHCLTACYLEDNQETAGAIAVLDSDVMAGSPDRDSADWLSPQKLETDLSLYERCTTYEVAAGNYLARNTPAARAFLLDWAAIEPTRPPGFSSCDNGALHVHLARIFVNDTDPQKKECVDRYPKLVDDCMHLDPYFKFITECRKALGMGHSQPQDGAELMQFRRKDRDGLILHTDNYVSTSTGYKGPLTVRIYPKSRGWVHDAVS